MLKYLLPLVLFIVLVVFLAIGLSNDPRYIPSPLIDKPTPGFSLPRLYASESKFGPDLLKGKVWLLNAWTSDCSGCRQEHPHLLALAGREIVSIIGLNYRDSDHLAKQLLAKTGNPYRVVVTDHDGSVGIDYGVYAVPETFLIDRKGIIRYKYIGPLFPKEINGTLIPLIEKLKKEPA
jgi:cytochrome c biogenesis protein CcmG/thiol:disulfide interchange protein DsbE